jgi:hypothetical protein
MLEVINKKDRWENGGKTEDGCYQSRRILWFRDLKMEHSNKVKGKNDRKPLASRYEVQDHSLNISHFQEP